jgi:hypothetical protein
MSNNPLYYGARRDQGRRLYVVKQPRFTTKYNKFVGYSGARRVPSAQAPLPCVLCKAQTALICLGTICQDIDHKYQPNALCSDCGNKRHHCPRCAIAEYYHPPTNNQENPNDPNNPDSDLDVEEKSFRDWSVCPSDLEDCPSEDDYEDYIAHRSYYEIPSGYTLDEWDQLRQSQMMSDSDEPSW